MKLMKMMNNDDDLTDVTVVSDDTYWNLTDVTPAIEEVMEVKKWWKLSSEECFQVMKIIKWW